MTFTYALQTPALSRLMDALGPSMRGQLLSAAARGVQRSTRFEAAASATCASASVNSIGAAER